MKHRFLAAVCVFVALAGLLVSARPSPPQKLVARIWHGVVPKAKADAYEKYLGDGVKQILAVKGNLGAQMMRRDNGKTVEFEVISYWPSRKAIEAFAGKNIEKTHSLPRDKEFLVSVEPTVRHYDVVFEQRH